MKKAVLACLAVAAILTLAVWAADISGTWVYSAPGRDGQLMERDITIVQTGNKIKVTMPGRPNQDGTPGEPIVGEGTLEGNAIQWTIVMTRPDGQEMKMEYKGTVDGNTMKGTTMRRDQEVEWTAKKK
ncbi:MAG: hypothetical protein H6P95_1365 [Candidatus Aminicenantes bacterium]|jgi:hypothetical protein|nr:hypothetical protein [Candidatus Aminicenantes bacterium]